MDPSSDTILEDRSLIFFIIIPLKGFIIMIMLALQNELENVSSLFLLILWKSLCKIGTIFLKIFGRISPGKPSEPGIFFYGKNVYNRLNFFNRHRTIQIFYFFLCFVPQQCIIHQKFQIYWHKGVHYAVNYEGHSLFKVWSAFLIPDIIFTLSTFFD